MGFKSTLSKVGSWLWSLVKTTAKNSQELILEDIRQIAYSVVEDVSNIDLNGDGRVSAASEVVSLAKASGQKWGKKLIADGETEAFIYLQTLRESDLRRWISLARVATAAADRFGFGNTPTQHVILGIIQAVLGAED